MSIMQSCQLANSNEHDRKKIKYMTFLFCLFLSAIAIVIYCCQFILQFSFNIELKKNLISYATQVVNDLKTADKKNGKSIPKLQTLDDFSCDIDRSNVLLLFFRYTCFPRIKYTLVTGAACNNK